MSFNQAYNTDNVFIRSVIIGLLDFLNTRVQIEQVMLDTPEKITVPFFYAKFGQERFLQDFYLKYKEQCDGPVYVEGGAEPVPRGILSMTGLSVNSSALTSKNIRGTYNKEIDGQVKAFSSYLNIIPMSLLFDVEIICNTLLESLKITQSVLGSMYKATKFNVDYNGFMCPVQVGLSEDYSTQKQVQYTYGDGEDKILIRFSMEAETYLPVPDITQERWRGNVMDGGIGNVIVQIPGQDTGAIFNVDMNTETDMSIYNTDPNGNPINPDLVPPADPDVNTPPN